jgi:trans-2,3-dihydro-3-hydroxyanthranilate isomerase
VGDLVWLQAAQPQFWILFKGRFHYFQQFSSTDFEDAFPIQEVTTGSAFVIVPLKNIKALERLIIDKDKMNNWMQANCKTSHRALYFLLFRRC